jgi:hypothetical protein
MKMDLVTDCFDFEISPRSMSPDSTSLVLTEKGYDKLRSAILAALS